MSITKYFIQNKKLTLLLMIFIMLAGLVTMLRTPRQDSPNVNFDIMMVTTVYPGASPHDVEINVTDKIEDELEEVDGIERINSYSVEGVSWIFITLDPDGNDIGTTKDDIKTAIDRVSDFPPAVEDRPQISELKTTDFPVLEVAIEGGENQEAKLRDVARELEDKLRLIGDVGGIDKIGYRKQEVRIEASLQKLQQTQTSFAELIAALKGHNVMLSGGSLESSTSKKKIITASEFQNIRDVENVIVRSNFAGKFMKVEDIAEVHKDFYRHEIINRTNGQNAINLIVKRKGNSDVIRLSDQLNEVVKAFSEKYKDQGIQVKVVVDFSHYTKSLLNIVTTNALLGFILVLVSLFVFLNFHTAFWVALGIPISILGAYLFFPVFGITTNQITLITIIMVLGMLVDDAIVVAENITRLQEEGMSVKDAALKGVQEVLAPVAATIATTIITFVPMYFMSGIMGKFIIAIPTVLILTLLMSLFESMTMLPSHLSMKKVKHDQERKWFTALKKKYSTLLAIFLHHKKTALASIFAGLIAVGIVFGYLGRFELFPTNDFDLFYIVMEAPNEYSLDATYDLVKQVEEKVAKISSDTMVNFKTTVGHHRTDEAAADPTLHENWALLTVYLHPASQREIRSEELIESLKKDMESVKGFTKLEVRELQDGPPVGEPIQVQLISDNEESSINAEKDLIKLLEEMPGVYNVQSSNRQGMSELRLIPNYERMASLGVKAEDVANTIRMAYDGIVATSLRRNGEEIDYRVQLDKSERQTINNVMKLTILNNTGRLIELGKLVSIEEGFAKQTIEHYNGKKTIRVTAKVDKKLINSHQANSQIKEKMDPIVKKIDDLRIEYGGEEKETMKSFEDFVIAFLCGILGIYFILVILTDSYFQPFIIMIAIPFGIVGVLVAFTIHGLPLSFLGIIGTLGMIGVVVNDSLVMVTHLNQLHKKHKHLTKELIIEGASTRLRPVLLTTITTLCGLMPTVYGWGGYEPFVVPMVLSMSYGLLFATIITLFLIPLLYTFVRGTYSASES